jgi:hypothetical protein
VTRAEELAEEVLDLYKRGIPGAMDAGVPLQLARSVLALEADAEALAEALEECKHLIGRLVMRHGFTDEAKADMRRVHDVSRDALARYRGEK